MKKEILKNIENYFDRKKAGTDIGFSLFNLNTFDALFQNLMTPTVKQQAISSIGIAMEMLEIDYDNIETDYAKEIKAIVKTSADKIVITNKTIDEEIRKKIKKILTENVNVNQNELQSLIESQVEQDFLNKYKNRSKTIATTTSTLTIGNSQNKVANKHKAKKRWLSMRDERVRDEHQRADGDYADETGYFNVGGEELPYPGGGLKGGNNINCRCRLRLEKQ